MWYEILPSLGLVTAFIAIPPIAARGINWLFLNGKIRPRWWEYNNDQYQMYLRDLRVTGSEYIPKGLEGLPESK